MNSKKASLTKSLGLFALAIGAFMTLRWALFEPFVIPSGSMIPTLLVNDHILVTKYTFGLRLPFTSIWLTPPRLPQRGDVVVFRSVEQDDYYLIKRVVGLPGDKVDFTADGDLLINDKLVTQTEQEWPSNLARGELQDAPESYKLLAEELGHHKHPVILEKRGFRYTESGHVVSPNHLFMMGDNRDKSRDSRFWGELPVEKLLGQAQWVWLSCSETLSSINFLCDPRHIRWQRTFHRIE